MNILSYFIEHHRYLNIIGIFFILMLAWLFSKNRTHINFKLVINALLLQLLIAFCVLKTTTGHAIINALAQGISKLYNYASHGSEFLFGKLIHIDGPWGFIFAIKVLPIIIFFGAFMALLFYCGIVQRLIGGINFVIHPLLGTSGAETLCAIANSFLGQTEAPLLIKNYIASMTKSEILVIMVSGMGTISGAILAIYVAMGVPAVHLLAASVMAIPATIMMAKILYPETEKVEMQAQMSALSQGNVLDAVASGTCDGLYLALNVGAMLIAFISLIALINAVLGSACDWINYGLIFTNSSLTLPCLSLQDIFGYIFAPFGYLLGLSGSEIFKAGQLIGIKVAINEMVAYSELINMHLSERATVLLTYALCGFSNFSCIGIQIGGIGALAPSKKSLISELGWYAVLGGALSNLLTALIAGLLI
ncbi:MAG: nucleoside transporter C-terminal domain-containing protein [Candidatus Babeliaceae bacterium]